MAAPHGHAIALGSDMGVAVGAGLNPHSIGDILEGMERACAVVIVVDGLRADALGSYGNAQAETPFLDRLAAESVLYDFAFSLDPEVGSYYASVLLGAHPAYRYSRARSQGRCDDSLPLAEMASQYLVTDEAAIARAFDTGRVWSDTLTISAAELNAGDQHRGLFTSAAEWLGDCFRDGEEGPRVGWIHVSLPSLGGPVESRMQYDARVTRVDQGLRDLFAELSFPESSRALCIVTAARGYALGERGQIGTQSLGLHEELVHIPLIVHAINERLDPLRTSRLSSPIDLGTFISEWLAGPAPAESRVHASKVDPTCGVKPICSGSPDYLFFANSLGDLGIRTAGWYLIRNAAVGGVPPLTDDQPAPLQLFLKPDDRWEFNEVSSLRPAIAEMLAQHLDDLERQARSGQPLNLPPLADELLMGA